MYESDYFNIVDKSYNNFDSIRFKTVVGVINKYLKGSACLDAGSGGGHYLNILSKSGKRAVGLEYSKDGIKDSKKRVVNTSIVNGSLIGEMPFRSHAFDFILCSEVMEHLLDLDAVISEFKRILKKDGCIVVTVPNFTKMSFEYLREIFSYKDPTHVRRYSLYKWKSLLSINFKIIDFFTSSFVPSYTLYSVGFGHENILKTESLLRKIPVVKLLGRECVFVLKLKP